MEGIKVLAFDTGGTVLDWHAGSTAAMAAWGTAHGIERDWHALANEHRRRSLRRMTNSVNPGFNIDDVHRDVLGELFDENGLGGSPEERQAIAKRWYQLDVWPDFPAALRRLRRHRICVSFTILNLSLIVDVSRRNGIDWDAVIPCEMLRVYKPHPDAYRRAARALRKKVELGDLNKQAFKADPARIGCEPGERRASAIIGQKSIQPLAGSSIEAIGDTLQRRIVMRDTRRSHDAVEAVCAGTDDPTASKPRADLVFQCRRAPNLASQILYHGWRQIGLIVGEAAQLAPESKLGSHPKLAATGKTGQ